MYQLVVSLVFLAIGFSSFAQQAGFIENGGQISDQHNQPRSDVLFSCETGGLVCHLRENGLSYQMNKVNSWKDLKSKFGEQKVPDEITIYRIDINWIGTNKDFTIKKGSANTGYSNYFREVCPNGVIGVKSFEGITYKNLYNEIDLKLYLNNGSLEYDYIVSPYADYKKIRWEIEGAEEIYISETGELVIQTPLGEIREGTPYAFQGKNEIEIEWKIIDDEIGFNIGDYNSSLPLVIDPIVRYWGTYFGGLDYESVESMTISDSSFVYLAGSTGSSTSISTSGSHQTTLKAFRNAFLAKFNAQGSRVWATYYGGFGYGNSCAVDKSHNVFLAGTTYSDSAISTPDCHQDSFAGVSDAFLVKFDQHGNRLWATYYGGISNDEGKGCAVDTNDNIYLAGWTASPNSIATTGSHQSNTDGWDAFLVKFNSNGVRQWGTYYGGNSRDEGNSCTVDKFSNVYISGITESTTSIATNTGFQNSIGGNVDGFLAKFSSNGIWKWGTYYGGLGDDWIFECEATNSLNVYITGMTYSNANISSPGSHQPFFGGMVDAFLVKFNNSGSREWGTYYGGSDEDFGSSCSLYKDINVYLVGGTRSDSNIATSGSYQDQLKGDRDAFVVKFDSKGIRQSASYYGDSLHDYASTCSIDEYSNVYVAGATESTSGIASPGTHQMVIGGQQDGFLIKFDPCGIDASVSRNGTWLVSNDTTGSYQWIDCVNGFTKLNGATNKNFKVVSNGSYAVVVSKNGCSDTSECYGINFVSISESEWDNTMNIYPNPNNGEFTIELGGDYSEILVEITNHIGQVIATSEYQNSSIIQQKLQGVRGLYLIHITTETGISASFKILKE